MNHEDINPLKAIEYIYSSGAKYAQAKAELTYLEEFRKSKKALLMKTAIVDGAKSVAAAEMEAYADSEYISLLTDIKHATEKAESFRWHIVAAQARIDVWRSMNASNRLLDQATM